MKHIAILTIIAGTLLSSCVSSATQENAATTDAKQPKAETPSKAILSDSSLIADANTGATAVSNMFTLNGILTVSAQNKVSVTLPMGGIVKNMKHLPGAYIKKGEVISTIENPEFITLQQTYLDNAAQMDYLEAEYIRQQSLAQQEAASQKKLQQSKADYLSAKSKKDAAAAQLSLLGVTSSKLAEKGIKQHIEVCAPIAGYISSINMNTGKYFNAGEPLCEITNKSNMLLKLIAYEKDLSKLKVGTILEFRVNGMGKTPFKAIISSIGQQIDATNRSLEVYATVKTNHELFRPGMYVTAAISHK